MRLHRVIIFAVIILIHAVTYLYLNSNARRASQSGPSITVFLIDDVAQSRNSISKERNHLALTLPTAKAFIPPPLDLPAFKPEATGNTEKETRAKLDLSFSPDPRRSMEDIFPSSQGRLQNYAGQLKIENDLSNLPPIPPRPGPASPDCDVAIVKTWDDRGRATNNLVEICHSRPNLKVLQHRNDMYTPR